MGSGQLIRSLLPHGMVDELLLMIHPVTLGSGQRLFGPPNDRLPLKLIESSATEKGVLPTIFRRRDVAIS